MVILLVFAFLLSKISIVKGHSVAGFFYSLGIVGFFTWINLLIAGAIDTNQCYLNLPDSQICRLGALVMIPLGGGAVLILYVISFLFLKLQSRRVGPTQVVTSPKLKLLIVLLVAGVIFMLAPLLFLWETEVELNVRRDEAKQVHENRWKYASNVGEFVCSVTTRRSRTTIEGKIFTVETSTSTRFYYGEFDDPKFDRFFGIKIANSSTVLIQNFNQTWYSDCRNSNNEIFSEVYDIKYASTFEKETN